jgi:hypothetical protein
MTRRPLANAIARRLQLVGDPDAYLRPLGLAIEETPDMRTALRVAAEVYATVQAREREREWQRS